MLSVAENFIINLKNIYFSLYFYYSRKQYIFIYIKQKLYYIYINVS